MPIISINIFIHSSYSLKNNCRSLLIAKTKHRYDTYHPSVRIFSLVVWPTSHVAVVISGIPMGRVCNVEASSILLHDSTRHCVTRWGIISNTNQKESITITNIFKRLVHFNQFLGNPRADIIHPSLDKQIIVHLVF